NMAGAAASKKSQASSLFLLRYKSSVAPPSRNPPKMCRPPFQTRMISAGSLLKRVSPPSVALITYHKRAPMIPTGNTQTSASQMASLFSPWCLNTRSTIKEATITPVITITPYQRRENSRPNSSIVKITGLIMYTSREIFIQIITFECEQIDKQLGMDNKAEAIYYIRNIAFVMTYTSKP